MTFNPNIYGAQVAELLALDGDGERLMPLAHGVCANQEAYRRLKGATAAGLFPSARAPEAALSGLYLYFSCIDDAHTIAQDIGTADGSFWHGILHRQEPDPGNAAYWFRRVGAHAVFPALAAAVREIAAGEPDAGISSGAGWDPFDFIETCERARRKPGTALERYALAVQRAEWQLLFDHCARERKA